MVENILSECRLFALDTGYETGWTNMALDDLLLEWARDQKKPVLVVRTYQWCVPTLSVGVNQSIKSIASYLSDNIGQDDFYSIVRRPTGGRAILHGEDVSFSFISNHPGLINQSIHDSYEVLNTFVQTALTDLGVATSTSPVATSCGYTTSSSCFETKTPSDLMDETGKKLVGAAQCRRHSGLLQHGAAFIESQGVSGAQFSKTLFEIVSNSLSQKHEKFPLIDSDDFNQELEAVISRYMSESAGILHKVSTRKGSHLEPASS